MPKSLIVATLPSDIEPLVAPIYEHGGKVEYDPNDSEDDVRAALSKHAGAPGVTIEFDDPENPLDPVIDVAKALAAQGVRYAYVTDAFTESTRGLRVLGRLVLSMNGVDAIQRDIPWQHGEPGIDRATMLACGYDVAESDALLEMFVKSEAPPPAPAP